jgi:hypothetical protein
MRRQRLTTVILALATGVSAWSAQPARSQGLPGGHTLTPTAAPKSIVLRSTHILLIEVITANAGPWAPSSPGLISRSVDLSLHVSEALRGKLDPAPGGPVHISITQSDYDGELMMQPLPGAWARVELLPGTALVVFAESDEVRVERILSEPACTRVVPAEPVLSGLRIAGQAEAGDLPLGRTLALAALDTDRLDSTFAEFLWDKYGDGAVASQGDFNLLADFAERKGFDAGTRQALLKGGYDLVGLYGDATPERAQRLALAMFRVLQMPEAADLRENLINTYIPNLLGITSGLPHQAASRVFRDHETDRNSVKSFLQGHKSDGDTAELLTWLDHE